MQSVRLGRQSPGDRTTVAGRAFTLVELLVVLAVISVLVSIMVPALKRARDQTKLTRCQSRLRNLGIGVLAYAAENRSWLPVEAQLDNPHRELMDCLHKRGHVPDLRTYYCPSQRRSDLVHSEKNVEEGNIGYFYYSCEQATRNRLVSTFLRWNVDWPRRMRDTMDPDMWVFSDSFFSGEPTAHDYYRKGVNYVTIGGWVRLLKHQPRRYFR